MSQCTAEKDCCLDVGQYSEHYPTSECDCTFHITKRCSVCNGTYTYPYTCPGCRAKVCSKDCKKRA